MTTYHGFDVMDYPGSSVVSAFKNSGPFSWIGFYLGGPSYLGTRDSNDRSTTWTREAYTYLKGLGYGVSALYCGSQRSGDLTESTARTHATQAAQWASDIGFPSDAAIFLDFEGGDNLTAAMIAYIKAFTSYLDTQTKYWGAVYCNPLPAGDL